MMRHMTNITGRMIEPEAVSVLPGGGSILSIYHIPDVFAGSILLLLTRTKQAHSVRRGSPHRHGVVDSRIVHTGARCVLCKAPLE